MAVEPPRPAAAGSAASPTSACAIRAMSRAILRHRPGRSATSVASPIQASRCVCQVAPGSLRPSGLASSARNRGPASPHAARLPTAPPSDTASALSALSSRRRRRARQRLRPLRAPEADGRHPGRLQQRARQRRRAGMAPRQAHCAAACTIELLLQLRALRSVRTPRAPSRADPGWWRRDGRSGRRPSWRRRAASPPARTGSRASPHRAPARASPAGSSERFQRAGR